HRCLVEDPRWIEGGFALPARPDCAAVSSASRRSSIPRISWSAVVIAVIVAVVGALWNAYVDDDASGTPIERGSALALLEELPVKGPAPGTGYDRVGGFGEAWLDVDGNGCDTRNDILRRDLEDAQI